jgi:hypothetical protein
MRVVIIPEDGFVAVDGKGYSDLDLSFIPYEVHALQWYDTDGEIEYQDTRGRATRNETITSLEQFDYWDQCYTAWQAAKTAAETPEQPAPSEVFPEEQTLPPAL